MDYAFLVLQRDEARTRHIQGQVKQHPYFRIIPALDAMEDWDAVERTLIDQNIRIGTEMSHDPVGKFGRWASFVQWLVWLSTQSHLNFGVLAEDDVVIKDSFKGDLDQFIVDHPQHWYFRCGPYNSCLVVKQSHAVDVLNLVRKTKITMPDDWWAWKATQILQPGPIHLVRQLRTYRSNIKTAPSFDRLIPRRTRNAKLWD